MDRLQPPCKVEDTLSFNFNLNFENLQKFLIFLSKNDSIINDNIRDINLKISQFEEIKNKLEETELSMNSYKKKFIEFDQSLYSHQNKIMETEANINMLNTRTNSAENKVSSLVDKISPLEENINNLNRLTEENIKNYTKVNELMEQVKNNEEILKAKSDNIDKRLEAVADNVLTSTEIKMKEFIDKTELAVEKKISEVKNYTKENVDKVSKKLNDSENTMIKVIESVSEITSNDRRKSTLNATNLISIQNEAQNNLIMSQLVKSTEELEQLKANNKLMAEKVETLSNYNEELKEKIKNINDKLTKNENIMNHMFNTNNVPESIPMNTDRNTHPHTSREQFHAPTSETSSTDMVNNIQKLTDNMKIFSQNLGFKASREDLERLNKNMKTEIDNLTTKLNETYKMIDVKLKSLMVSGGHASNNFAIDLNDPNFGFNMQEAIAKISKEVIDKEISCLNFGENEFFKEAQFKIDYNKTEIDRIYESIIEIRKAFLETNSPMEDNIRETNSRVLEVEINMRKFRMQLEEVTKNLEGENTGDDENKSPHKDNNSNSNIGNGSLREYVRNLAMNMKIFGDKVDKIGQKQDNMNAEILAKVKKDLQYESTRILDDFKQDLKSSINKIEDQLREKVDRFNLDEFGKKIDSKFNFEINKKLDRLDLKKNNNLINKKIDTLENKISKTLVDTLIDLQMEEAPLIVKKSMNGEKCASCNQSLPNTFNFHDSVSGHYETKHPYRTANKFNTTHRQGDMKFNQINEVSEEGLPNKKVQLPDINSNLNKSSANFSSNLQNKKKQGNKKMGQTYYAKLDDGIEKDLNSIINEEGDNKKVLNSK